MAEIIIITKTDSPAEVMQIKNAIQQIASNFNKDNLKKISDLSNIPDANNKLQSLFDNPLFKMAIKK